jgi:2-polyprenyl-3-methyl-5-hydroxy-6-metoxy-1,4-benzoquinol methylase
MHREYDKYAEGDIHWQWYHNTPAYFALVNFALQPLKDAKPGSVVDIGCGDGLALSFLDDWGFKCFGVDPSYEGVDWALKHNITAEFFIEQAEKFATRSMEVDYLFSMNTIEHLDDPKAMVEIMKHVSKFGIIVTDDGSKSPAVNSYHEQEFTAQSFAELFKEFNFERLDVPAACGPYIAFKVWRK